MIDTLVSMGLNYSNAVFTCWSESEECGFLPLQRLLPLNGKEVGIPLRGPHPFLEWGVGVGLPLREVRVRIHSHLSLFYPFIFLI